MREVQDAQSHRHLPPLLGVERKRECGGRKWHASNLQPGTKSHVGTFLVCMNTYLLPSHPHNLDQLQRQFHRESEPTPEDHCSQHFS